MSDENPVCVRQRKRWKKTRERERPEDEEEAGLPFDPANANIYSKVIPTKV